MNTFVSPLWVRREGVAMYFERAGMSPLADRARNATEEEIGRFEAAIASTLGSDSDDDETNACEGEDSFLD